MARVDYLKGRERDTLWQSARKSTRAIARTTNLSKSLKKRTVDVSNIVVCERIGSGCSGAVVYSCIVDGKRA